MPLKRGKNKYSEQYVEIDKESKKRHINRKNLIHKQIERGTNYSNNNENVGNIDSS